MPLRVLCLDSEGGFGGSSRSLFESLAHMERSAIAPTIWCAREGPIIARYAALGMACQAMPLMPRFSALPRLSRSFYSLLRVAQAFRRARPFLAELLRAANESDVVHLNHESLFLLARWLKRRSATPLVMHLRTNLVDSPVARWQTRIIARSSCRLVFITENERDSFVRLGGDATLGAVIYNIARPPAEALTSYPAVPADGRFNVAALANFALVRGTDRLLEVAAELKRQGRRDIRIVVAGDMRLRGRLPRDLKTAGPSAASLDELAKGQGLDDVMLFLGHVAEPDRVLAACHALLRLSRGDDPWGRDVIEALAAGLPVIATGCYDRFVETSVTGTLLNRYSAAEAAKAVIALADDRENARALGAAGQARALSLCDGKARAADLLSVWQAAASAAR